MDAKGEQLIDLVQDGQRWIACKGGRGGLGGLGEVTGEEADNGLFRTPTLRNIALTAPYMHDGRFETLEEVLDHYSEGIKSSPNLDFIIQADFGIPGKQLTQTEKEAIIAFLHTLTDTTFINNPAFSNPFE